MTIQNAKPVDDLELYELIVAAYPEKFDADSEDCIWDEVMEWTEEQFGDLDVLSQLLGKLVYLTSPMQSAISGEYVHFATVENNELVIRVSADYIKNSAECALTTGGEKTVSDESAMLTHYAAAISSDDDNSHFNHCLDFIAEDACDGAETWINWDAEPDGPEEEPEDCDKQGPTIFDGYCVE